MSSSPLPVNPARVVPISPGVAIGPAHIFRAAASAIQNTKILPQQVEAELQRLQEAIAAASQELQELQAQVAKTVGQNEAAIFEAHELIVQDPDLLEEAQEAIATGLFSASVAFQQAAERQAQQLEALASEMFAARAADVRDVSARVLRHLSAEGQAATTATVDKPALIVAYDLTPSDTATFDPARILGICSVVGGPTTHAAIIARALEIPAVCGIDAGMLECLRDGQQLAIDGAQGLFYTQLDIGRAS